MTWKLFPTLQRPDYRRWERHFPSGVGGSAFGSPAFQRIMLREFGTGWRPRLLRTTGGSQDLSLPVFARKDRHLRAELVVHPNPYYVIPIERDVVTSEVVTEVLDEVDRAGTSIFTWWLPPWTSWSPADFDAGRYGDRLSLSAAETFVIPCDATYEDHMSRRVRKTRRWEARISLFRGLEVLESPSPVIVDEYFQLYCRVRTEQRWVGHAFSRQFFHDVATRLGAGGQLLVLRLENRVIGGGVLLFDRHAVHYYQGTTDRAVKGVFPHTVLMVEALKRSYGRGLRYVNLGGVNAGNNSLIEFKEGWGGERTAVPMLHWQCSAAQAGRMALSKLLVRPPGGHTAGQRFLTKIIPQ